MCRCEDVLSNEPVCIVEIHFWETMAQYSCIIVWHGYAWGDKKIWHSIHVLLCGMAMHGVTRNYGTVFMYYCVA